MAIKVNILSSTHDPEMTCALAAGKSTGRPVTKETHANLLRKVIGYGHLSIAEHASFTFHIEGISRACSHQLVRHRIASFTQESQRYVKYDSLNFVTPATIKGNAKAKLIYEKCMHECEQAYKLLIEEGVPKEDARYVFPNATHTSLIMTMNGRELMHFFGLRLCVRAQSEIREMAHLMLAEVKKVSPVIFENADAQCAALGYCPEHESCGRYPKKQ